MVYDLWFIMLARHGLWFQPVSSTKRSGGVGLTSGALFSYEVRSQTIQSTVFISHLTNSNGCGNVQPKVLLTVSPFSPSFSPATWCVFATFQFFRPAAQRKSRRFILLRALELSCRFFCNSDPLFSTVCTLFLQNARGWVCLSHPSATFALWDLCAPISVPSVLRFFPFWFACARAVGGPRMIAYETC